MVRWILLVIVAVVGFAGDVKICLSLVVRNDEETIFTCLNDLKDLVDCISIYDAGSTDQTLKIARQFLSKSKIPAVIQSHDPKSQAHPDSFALEIAKRVIKNYRLIPEDTYILSLEPNMHLQIGSAFSKNNLTEDGYLVLEKTSCFSSYHPHLFRSSANSVTTRKIKSLTIEKQENPALTLDSLLHALKKQPDNSRHLFTIAKSKQALHQYEEAIQFYEKVLAKESSSEEGWFSRLMIGECYETLRKWDEALFWYLEAFQANPSRAEPLKKISAHYRLLGANSLSHLFAKVGSGLTHPDDQLYFDAQPLQDYEFDEELSIVSYYTQFKEDGYAAASDLVLKRGVPYAIRQQTYRNLLFYVEPLQGADFLPIDIELPFIREEIRWNPSNPSIRKVEEGYQAICRTVNYVQKEAREFHSHDEDGYFRSRNYLVQYDRDFRLLSQLEILEDQVREKIGKPLVQGFEDCRIFGWGQSSWFTCTTTDTNPTGSFQISLCKMGEDLSKGYVPVASLLPLKGPDPYRCEKNWLPFVQDEKFYAIYSYDPFIIYEIDPHTGHCKTARQYQPEHDFSSFRGSAGPLAFEDGYLLLVHEIAFLDHWARNYLHRFLFLDKDFKITKVSKPFVFKHNGVEFCNSMCLDHTGEKLILAVGIEDREAHLCIIDRQTVKSLLKPMVPQ